MIRANIHAVKTHLSRYLARVATGETIVICNRNVPVAEIRPVAARRTARRPVGRPVPGIVDRENQARDEGQGSVERRRRAGGALDEPSRLIALETPDAGRHSDRQKPQQDDADDRGGQRARPTPTRRHDPATGQREQWGESGRQTFWPNATRRSLYPIQ